MFSIREIIDIAIKIEKNGESFYREAMEKVSNPALKPVLLFLADQEHEHVLWFEKLKDKTKAAEGEQKVAEIGEAMLQNLVGDQTFSLDDADLSGLDTVASLIELAIELEKDTILFYQMLQTFIEDSATLKELNEIIAEESRHIEILREYEGWKTFHLTAVFEEFNILLTNMLAIVFANDTVNIPLCKVFSDGK